MNCTFRLSVKFIVGNDFFLTGYRPVLKFEEQLEEHHNSRDAC